MDEVNLEQPLWNVYPQNWYDISTQAVSSEIWPPVDVEMRQAEYLSSGTRSTAVAVFLTHRWLMPHLLVLNQTPPTGGQHTGLFATKIVPTENLQDQLKLYVKTIYEPKSPTEEIIIGPLICSLWVTSSGNYTTPVPVLPLHCTRPRELVSFYQVQVPHTGAFKLPGNTTLKAVPLTDIQLPSFRFMPYALSRFKLNFYDADDTVNRDSVN